MTQYKLTSADVMELRASVRWRLADGGQGGREGDGITTTMPFICYAREDRLAANAPGYDPESFVLHTQGHLRAICPRIEVLAACLRAEWAEPGFVERILRADTPCDEALLSPDEQARLRSRRLFEEKAAREFAAEQQRQAANRPRQPTPRQPDPTTITASDLFDD